jgi:hypothetical protein
MISEQQIETMIALSAPLVEHPLPWAELSPEQEAAFRVLLPLPGVGFDATQREWLSLWWLPVTPEGLAALNALMPPHHVLAAREDTESNLWLSADVLSDAIDGGRLAALWPLVSALPLNYRPVESWPVPLLEGEGD